MKDSDQKTEPKKEEKERKSFGWFSHRPAMTNAQDELVWAQKLEGDGKASAAEAEYLALVRMWHDSAQAPVAQLGYARLLEQREKYSDAFDEYQYLIDHYAGSFKYEDVLDRQFRIACQVMNERHWAILGFSGFRAPEAALPMLEKIAVNAPSWDKTAEVRFYTGVIHEENGDLSDAVRAYEASRQKHPKSPFVLQAEFRRANCLYKDANENSRDERKCRNALSALATFLADFPDNEKTTTAQQYRDELKERLADMYYDRALFYDRLAERSQPQSAVIAYTDFLKKFPKSERAGKVRQRIEELKQQLAKED